MVDLTDLGDVKDWLGFSTAQTAADVRLGNLITSTSADFLRAIDRMDFMEDVYTEARTGDGGNRLLLRHWPVTQITTLTVAATAVTASADQVAVGFYIDTDMDIERRRHLWLAGSAFTDGASIVIGYVAGYAAPPQDVSQAVLEWVCERFKGRPGQGIASQREAGGEHVTYERADSMPATTAAVVERYLRTWPSTNKYRDDRNQKITRINSTTTTRISIKDAVSGQ
jgi:hypothetical protein